MIITQKRPRRHPVKPIWHGCNVYAESNADKAIDAFFNENKIWSLDFKCKTWAKMKSAATKLTVAAMREVFGETAKIAYSHKAGCSCGCSPGYKVREMGEGREYENHDVWAKITVNVNELVAKLPAYKLALDAEIAANK